MVFERGERLCSVSPALRPFAKIAQQNTSVFVNVCRKIFSTGRRGIERDVSDANSRGGEGWMLSEIAINCTRIKKMRNRRKRKYRRKGNIKTILMKKAFRVRYVFLSYLSVYVPGIYLLVVHGI